MHDPPSAQSVKPEAEGSAAPLIPHQCLLDLHVAEYQALTTRCTYWMTLHYALWPILLLSLALASQLHARLELRVGLWGSVIAVQVTLIAYYTSILEHYAAVQYIERRLRPLIEAAIGGGRFWEYESYVNSHRPREPGWWEYSPVALSALALLAGSYYSHWTWSVVDWLGYSMAAICSILAVKSAVRSARLRKAFFVAA
jgi:hypothetical protein